MSWIMEKQIKNVALRPVTIRFPKDEFDAIRATVKGMQATEEDKYISLSELVRKIVIENINKQPGNIRAINRPQDSKLCSTTIRFKQNVFDTIQEKAKIEGVSISKFVRAIISENLEKYQENIQITDSQQEQEAEEKPNILLPVTVRFTKSTLNAMQDAAEKSGMSLAEFIRMAVSMNMKNIRTMDRQQGEEIRKAVLALSDTISKIENELHRIGVNFNQVVRLKQIERRYGTNGKDLKNFSVTESDKEWKDRQAVMKDSSNLSKQELDDLMSRYENATKQVGDILCRILM